VSQGEGEHIRDKARLVVSVSRHGMVMLRSNSAGLRMDGSWRERGVFECLDVQYYFSGGGS
jgi:hypothetical protein